MKTILQRSNRRTFTLLETLLVITLLVMLGGLLLFKGKDLLETYAFRGEIAKLSRRLELAKQLSSSYESDVELVFSQKKGHLWLEIRSDEPHLQHHQAFFQPIEFKKIDKVLTQEGVAVEYLLFAATGWTFPSVCLYVVSVEKNEPSSKKLTRIF